MISTLARTGWSAGSPSGRASKLRIAAIGPAAVKAAPEADTIANVCNARPVSGTGSIVGSADLVPARSSMNATTRSGS